MDKTSTAKKVVDFPSVNRAFLADIAQGKVQFVSKEEGESLLLHNPPLIEVNLNAVDPNNADKVLCRITSAGAEYLIKHVNPVNEIKLVSNSSAFEVITNAVLPAFKRGGRGGGAPIKYPFDKLEVGNSFFVPATEKIPNPLNTLGSTISSANLRYATEIGNKEVTRAKRGKRNKLVLDDNGQKIMETKTVPVYEFARKFSMRGVETGKTYGGWIAPSNGVLVGRVA